jgi:hypothetical protein
LVNKKLVNCVFVQINHLHSSVGSGCATRGEWYKDLDDIDDIEVLNLFFASWTGEKSTRF